MGRNSTSTTKQPLPRRQHQKGKPRISDEPSETTQQQKRKETNHPHLESPFQTKDKYARPLITPLRSFQGKLLLPAAAAQPLLRQTPKRDFSIAVANETLRLCRNGLLAACHLLPPPLSLSRCFPRPLLLNNTTKTVSPVNFQQNSVYTPSPFPTFFFS